MHVPLKNCNSKKGRSEYYSIYSEGRKMCFYCLTLLFLRNSETIKGKWKLNGKKSHLLFSCHLKQEANQTKPSITTILLVAFKEMKINSWKVFMALRHMDFWFSSEYHQHGSFWIETNPTLVDFFIPCFWETWSWKVHGKQLLFFFLVGCCCGEWLSSSFFMVGSTSSCRIWVCQTNLCLSSLWVHFLNWSMLPAELCL